MHWVSRYILIFRGPSVLEEARKRHGNPKLRASDIEMNELFVAVKDYHLEPYATQNLMDFCMNHQLLYDKFASAWYPYLFVKSK